MSYLTNPAFSYLSICAPKVALSIRNKSTTSKTTLHNIERVHVFGYGVP